MVDKVKEKDDFEFEVENEAPAPAKAAKPEIDIEIEDDTPVEDRGKTPMLWLMNWKPTSWRTTPTRSRPV